VAFSWFARSHLRRLLTPTTPATIPSPTGNIMPTAGPAAAARSRAESASLNASMPDRIGTIGSILHD